MERVYSVAAVRRPTGSFFSHLKSIQLTIFIICAAAVSLAQNSNDRGTPADSKKGQSNQSTYARDKIETVNLANGNLSLSIPLATVGGRGSASFTITLNYNSRVWSAQSDGNGISTGGGAMGTLRNVYSAMYDKQNAEDYEPYMGKLGGGWSILWAPGIKMLKIGIDPIRTGCNVTEEDQPFCGYKYVLSKMWVTLPDGSQLELRDVATQGAPSPTTHVAGGYHYFEDQDRGRVWRSIDGSNVIFVRDPGYPVGAAQGEHELPTGWVFLPDGTRIRMANAVGNKIIDRNGNFILLEDGGWTDQLGRRTLINTAEGLVTVKGYMGVPDRSISVDFGTIGDAVNLRDDFHSLPRPFTTGDAYRDVLDGENSNFYQHTIQGAHTDLFLNSEGIRAYNTTVGFDVGTASALTRVNLPDGRSLRFRYNPYGEVAEIIYPGGGISQIDYTEHFTNCEIHAPFRVGRGVAQRRTLKADSTVEGTWDYAPDTITINGAILPGVAVAVYQGAPTGTLLSSERHFFKALNAEYRPCSGSLTLTGNEKWESNKEFRTEIYSGSGTRVVTREWQQRANLAWNSSYVNDAGHGQEQPPNDPRVMWEETTLEDGKVKRVEYGYDQFNNVTSIKEYDFNTSGSTLLRETVRTYGSSINGHCYSNLNPTDSSCGSGLASDVRTIIYQPSLLLNETVYDGNGNQKSRTEFEYDNYTAGGDRPPMSLNAGMIQYDATQFSPFSSILQPRGNVTKTTRWLNGGTDIVASSQYDNAGQMIWSKDPNGNVSTVSYQDNFGDGNNPDAGVQGPSGATFALASVVTNALGHQARMQYAYALGAATGSKDPNGMITKTEYDDLGRAIRATAGLGLSEASVTEMVYPTAQMNSLTVSKQLDATRWLTAKTDFDGFDRPIRSWQAEDGQELNSAAFTIRTDTEYDAIGRVKKVSNPYRPAETPAYNETSYDLAGRLVTVKTPDNAIVATEYDGNRVLVIDQAGRKRISATDALGRLTNIWEVTEDNLATDPANEVVSFPGRPEIQSAYRTTYQYDTLDDLIEVAQGSQPHRTFAYDSLKRLVSASNPESGTVGYQYDANGSLIVKTDARGVSAHYEYDGLNRVSRRWYNGSNSLSATIQNSPALPAGVGVSDEVKYFYDSQALPGGAPTTPEFSRGYAVGRLVAITYGGGSNGDYYGYDLPGRIKPRIQRTGGVNYKVDAVYNSVGAITSQTYPSGKTVNYTYDGAGRTSAFTGTLGDGNQRTYATGINYTSLGGLQEERFGTDTPLYHKQRYNKRGQLWDMRASTVSFASDPANGDRGAIVNYYSSNFSQGQSGADNNGNLRRQEIFIPNSNFFQDNFEYDSLNRLTSIAEKLNGAGADSFKQAYSYDRWGNRQIKNYPATSGTGINNTQNWIDSANNRLFAPSDQNVSNPEQRLIRYDAAGNQKADYYSATQGTRVYDAENRMTTATDTSNNTSTYIYDGGGRRIKRIVGSVETWQVYGLGGELLAEYASGAAPTNAQREYGYRNGELLITADVPEANGETFRASTDFLSVQGQKNWYYQNGDGSSMNYVSANNWWVGSEQYNLLWGNGGHPGNTADAVRQWRAPQAGTIHITGSASDANVACGNGVIVSIKKGATVLWQQTINNGNTDGFSYDLTVNVTAGDQINFVINARGENICDSTNFDPAISYVRTYQASADFGSAQGQKNWYYQNGAGSSMNYVPANNWWLGSEQYNLLWGSGGHPGNATDAVRQWRAPQAGTIRITGSAADGNYACGDGVIVSIQKGAEVLWQQTILNGNTSGFAYDITVAVAAGEQINFVINKRANYDCDSTNFDPTIVYTSGAIVHWLVADQLGTPRIILDQTGSLANVSRHDYLPFGEELFGGPPNQPGVGGRTTAQGYTASDNVRQKFTSYERDLETSLDYAHARYYANTQGRFTSVDPLAASASVNSPQSWNRYIYCVNNPLRFTDPLGMEPGDYVDEKGHYLGTDGKNDGNIYVVPNGEEKALIKANAKNKSTTDLSSVPSAELVPSESIREEINQALQRSNSPTKDDKKGGSHEEAIVWQNGSVTARAAGPVNDPRKSTIAVRITVTAETEGTAHIHPKEQSPGNQRSNSSAIVFPSPAPPTNVFVQYPSPKDLREALPKGTNIVVGASNHRVYFYRSSGNREGCNCTAEMSFKTFMKLPKH